MKHPDPARSSTGLLRVFHEGGLLSWGDVHTAQTVSRLFDETEDNVKLAFALTVRALRAGSVCLDLGAARGWAVAADEDSPTSRPGSGPIRRCGPRPSRRARW